MNTAKYNPMDASTVILSAIIISAMGALFYNLMPMYLGTAQDSKGLSNTEIGFIGTAFFLGYNLATVSAFYWIRRWSWRLTALLATPVTALGLYASTLTESYAGMLVATAIAGGAFATIYGLGTIILAETSNPVRWFGLKIAAETLYGSALLLLLPGLAISGYGYNGMILAIVFALLALCPLLFFLPAHGNKTHAQEVIELEGKYRQAESVNHWAIWTALLATLIFFSGVSAVWAFLERLGSVRGYDPSDIGLLLAATLIFATLGSLTVAGIGKRFGNVRPFLASLVLICGSLLLLQNASTLQVYAAGCCLFALAFGAGTPLAVAEVAELDVDGRYVILSVPAIGIGAMIGPGAAGMLYTGDSTILLLGLVAISQILAAALMWNAQRIKNQ